MLKWAVCILILVAAWSTQVVLTCGTNDDDQIKLLQLEVNNLTQKVEALINQRKRNCQLLLEKVGLYVPPHLYIYELTPGVQSWQESRQYCQNWGGDLAVHGVKTLENRRKLIQRLSISNWVWIGANDIASEGNWIWVNGERAKSSELIWASGEPDDLTGDDDCADVYGNPASSNHGHAFGYQCAGSLKGICEKKI